LALELVAMHLHEENPNCIDKCVKLYSEDAVWQAPARGVSFAGRETIKSSHLRVFGSTEGIMFQPNECFATPDCVRDDMWATFPISGDGFENCPLLIGTMVKMRLLHNFRMRDRLIYKERKLKVKR
jgi:hypothetical protein